MSYWMMLRRKRLIAACGGINIAALAIAYTGNMTDEIVNMTDGDYRLLTLTSSGTLTIPKEVAADVWLCGGGAKGQSQNGGGGGYVASYSGILPLSSVTTVGAGNGGGSSFVLADSTLTANGGSGKNGGSGGGSYSTTGAGTGAGVTTYPFGDTVYFAGRAHSAGGGAGSTQTSSRVYRGGDGGSNGSNGSTRTTHSYDDCPGGAGGSYGGGAGGRVSVQSNYGYEGSSAFFYGGGGGGEGDGYEYTISGVGSGYQGVIYVRFPLKQ